MRVIIFIVLKIGEIPLAIFIPYYIGWALFRLGIIIDDVSGWTIYPIYWLVGIATIGLMAVLGVLAYKAIKANWEYSKRLLNKWQDSPRKR